VANNIAISGYNSGDLTPCSSDPITRIPNPYIKTCFNYQPVLMLNESYSIQINFDEPVSDIVSSLAVGLVRYDSVMSLSLAPVSRVEVEPGLYNWYFTVLVSDTLNLPLGDSYRLIIHDTAQDQIRYISNPVQLMSTEQALPTTSVISYRNSTNRSNFAYSELADWRNVARVHLVDPSGPQDETEGTVFTASNTGTETQLNTVQRTIRVLRTVYFDNEAHEAMQDISSCDSITINGGAYTKKEPYEVSKESYEAVSIGNWPVIDESRIRLHP